MRIRSIAFAAVLFISSCKSGSSDSPTAVVNKFFSSMKEGNIADFKKYITKSDVSMLESIQKMSGMFNPEASKKMEEQMAKEFKDKAKDAKFEIKDEKINGDKATVTVSATENGKTDSHPIDLVKEDGSWKISLISTGMSGDGMDPEKMKHMQEGMERFKNMNADSIKELMDKGMEQYKKINQDSLKEVMEKAMKGQ